MQDVNKRRRISFSLSKRECGPREINSKEIQQIGINATKIEKTGIHFKTDVFAAVAVVDAKTPLRYHDSDGHENVTYKVNLRFFNLYRDYSNSFTLSNASELFLSRIPKNHIQVQIEKENLAVACLCPS